MKHAIPNFLSQELCRDLLPATCLELRKGNRQVSYLIVPRFLCLCLAIEAIESGYAEGNGLAMSLKLCTSTGIPGIAGVQTHLPGFRALFP